MAIPRSGSGLPATQAREPISAPEGGSTTSRPVSQPAAGPEPLQDLRRPRSASDSPQRGATLSLGAQVPSREVLKDARELHGNRGALTEASSGEGEVAAASRRILATLHGTDEPQVPASPSGLQPSDLPSLSQSLRAALGDRVPQAQVENARQRLDELRRMLDGVRDALRDLTPDALMARKTDIAGLLPQVRADLSAVTSSLERGLSDATSRQADGENQWGRRMDELVAGMNGGQSIGNAKPLTMAILGADPRLRQQVAALINAAPEQSRAEMQHHIAQGRDSSERSMADQRALSQAQLKASECTVAVERLSTELNGGSAARRLVAGVRRFFGWQSSGSSPTRSPGA